jgi:hypothetical protein
MLQGRKQLRKVQQFAQGCPGSRRVELRCLLLSLPWFYFTNPPVAPSITYLGHVGISELGSPLAQGSLLP